MYVPILVPKTGNADCGKVAIFVSFIARQIGIVMVLPKVTLN
jgi:hypothetical protein